MRKLVIFDFDFTLGDSSAAIVECMNFALDKMGYPAQTPEAIYPTIGMSLQLALAMFTGDKDPAHGEEFIRLFRVHADKVMAGMTYLYSGVPELLCNLRSLGLAVAVVTTKYHRGIQRILERTGIEGEVDFIVGSDEVKLPKPDPESVELVLEHFSCSPSNVLYVGDSATDAKTAEAALVDFVGVTTGTTSAEELAQYPHVAIIEHVDELRELSELGLSV